MRFRNLILSAGIAALALAGGRASAEIIELTNGHVLQGDIVAGQTTDEGLALNLYDTNGVVVVRWDHIVESRRKQLRLENGIDLPEETVEFVDGHKVLLASGETVYGVSPNPRDSAPLKMKTRTGVKEYDRSMLAGKVEDARIDGLIVYTVEELYQKIRDDQPPESSFQHKTLAQRCMNIGAYDHAKEHLLVCKSDAAFMDTPEGKSVDAMLRQADVMIRAKGAQDLVQQIKQAQNSAHWNDARKLLQQLGSDFKDDVIRKAINFDLLEARVLKGRDTYFQRQVAIDFYKVMDNLIDAKCRERKPSVSSTNEPKAGAAAAGTLAAARQWANRELSAQVWDKVAQDLGLTKDELQEYWKNRSVKTVRKANYGTGSFIVVKKASAGPKPGGAPEPPRRRPAGSDKGGGGKNVPDKPQKVDKPLTEEEWWDVVGPSDRSRWLTAYFVESSGWFSILRTDATPCQSCGGIGFTKSTGTDGGEEQQFCHQCNASGTYKSVSYR